MSVINAKNLRSFAYSNDEILEGPARGVILDFYGLDCHDIHNHDTKDGIRYAKEGIVFLHPYTNPWAWMNPDAVAFTDEILDALFDKLSLSSDTPIVSSGGSMGGQQSLIFPLGSRHREGIVMVASNCPVCDMVYHYGERPDLPRTIYSAVFHMAGGFDAALKALSPIHRIEDMPKIPYRIFHCDADKLVNYEIHGHSFTEKMREAGYDISLRTVPGRDHCDLGKEAAEEYFAVRRDAIIGH